jgi:hypothetical protein
VDVLKTKMPFAWFFDVVEAFPTTFSAHDSFEIDFPADPPLPAAALVLLPATGAVHDFWATYVMPLLTILTWGGFVFFLWEKFSATSHDL